MAGFGIGQVTTVLALLALPLPAVTPFLQPGMAATHDGLFHVFRAVQLEACLREGTWYPRWAPDFVQGLGYPVFNFYAPLTTYLMVLLHWLGLDYVMAYQAAIGLALLVAGAGMYLFARPAFGREGAFLAAAAYVYAPYLLVDAHLRGALPELLALGLLPLILWGVNRLLTSPSLGRLVVAAFLYAALIFTHNLTALFFTPVLLAYGGMEAARCRRPSGVAYLGGALALAVALSALHWVPAWGERHWVQTNLAVDSPQFDFRHSFLPPEQMWGLQPAIDLRRGDRGPELRLGVPQWGLGALGLAIQLRRWRRAGAARSHAVFFAGLALLLVWLMHESSVWLWDRLPMMAYLQFSWRWLGPASLALAVLAGATLTNPDPDGAGATGSRRAWARSARLAALLVVVMLVAFPYLFVFERAEVAANPTIADALAYERQSGTVGTTTSGEFLPVWVKWLPPPPPDLGSCRECPPAERLDRGTWPPGVAVAAELVGRRGDYEAYRVVAEEPIAFLFRLLYYPAWRAYLNGAETPARPFEGYGLGWTIVELPAGESLLELRFEDTPMMRLGNGLSAAAATGVAAWVAWSIPRRRRAPVREKAPATPDFPTPALAVALVALLLFLGKALYVDTGTAPFRFQSPAMVAEPAQNPMAVGFEEALVLLGYDMYGQPARPGGRLRLRLYWEPVTTPEADYGSVVEVLASPTEPPVAAAKGLFGRWIPTRTWRQGNYYVESLQLSLPDDLPPGEYMVICGVYDPRQGERRLYVMGSRPPRTYEVLERLVVR